MVVDAGHHEALQRAGVNYDDWPSDVYKSVPYFTFDPAATHSRMMNQVRPSALLSSLGLTMLAPWVQIAALNAPPSPFCPLSLRCVTAKCWLVARFFSQP